MCDFLTGQNHRDKKRIAELEAMLDAERHACDAIFSATAHGKSSDVLNLYSRLLSSRSNGNYEGIIERSHVIIENSMSDSK